MCTGYQNLSDLMYQSEGALQPQKLGQKALRSVPCYGLFTAWGPAAPAGPFS
jgi:hypothetical protein